MDYDAIDDALDHPDTLSQESLRRTHPSLYNSCPQCRARKKKTSSLCQSCARKKRATVRNLYASTCPRCKGKKESHLLICLVCSEGIEIPYSREERDVVGTAHESYIYLKKRGRGGYS